MTEDGAGRRDDRAAILVTGACGFVGSRIRARLIAAGHRAVAFGADIPQRLDLETPGAAAAAVLELAPAAIVHAAAMSSVGACEAAPDLAARVNADAAIEIAGAARALGARLIFLSTDMVLDGRTPGTDDAAARPLNVYGRTKARAEDGVLARCPDAAVARLSLVFGRSPSGGRSASEAVVAALRGRSAPTFYADEIRTPVAAGRVAEIALRLIAAPLSGVLAVPGPEALDRHAFALAVARALGFDPSGLRAGRAAEAPDAHLRPRNAAQREGRVASLFASPQEPLGAQVRAEHGAIASRL